MNKFGPNPGWYPDPGGSTAVRWWDGAGWGPLAPVVQPIVLRATARVSVAAPESPAQLPDPRFGAPQVYLPEGVTPQGRAATYAANLFGTPELVPVDPGAAWGLATSSAGNGLTAKGCYQASYGKAWSSRPDSIPSEAGKRALAIALLPLIVLVVAPLAAFWSHSTGGTNSHVITYAASWVVLAILTVILASRDIKALAFEGRRIGEGCLVAAVISPWLYLASRYFRLRSRGATARLEGWSILIAMLTGLVSAGIAGVVVVVMIGPSLNISRVSIANQVAAQLTHTEKMPVRVFCEGSPKIVQAEVFYCKYTTNGRSSTIRVTMDEYGRWTASRV